MPLEEIKVTTDLILRKAKCLLCKNPEVAIAHVYIPTRSMSGIFGKPCNNPEDKRRCCFYGLCRECKDLPNLKAVVEKVLVNMLAPNRN